MVRLHQLDTSYRGSPLPPTPPPPSLPVTLPKDVNLDSVLRKYPHAPNGVQVAEEHRKTVIEFIKNVKFKISTLESAIKTTKYATNSTDKKVKELEGKLKDLTKYLQDAEGAYYI